MPQSRIEPLINEYARLANYPAELVVRSVRQSDSSPYSYLVGARPVHRGLTYSSGSQAVFELDYRTGRLYSMSLYGVPRPPASITPGVSLESSRIATLSNLLERYRIPGVEVKEFKLVIFGKLVPIENDDAVKASQRIWNVQGQLGYEGLFWSLDQVNGIPSKRYTALVDANTNEPYAMSEASRGGMSSGKPSEMKVNLEGSVTVRLGKATQIATGAGVVFEQDKQFGDGVQVLLIGKERAYRAEYDRLGELLKIDGKIYKPSEGLSKALRGLK